MKSRVRIRGFHCTRYTRYAMHDRVFPVPANRCSPRFSRAFSIGFIQKCAMTKKNFSLMDSNFYPQPEYHGHTMAVTGTQFFKPFRDIPVDVLRGLAIAIMVGANLVPALLLPPAPFWLRSVASLAAPLFIFLSGMMIALSFRMKNRTFSYFLIRGGFILVIASLIDLVLRESVPLISMDVLYLIGLSLPLGYLFLSLGLRARAAILAALVIATPLLQTLLGYPPLSFDVPIISFLSGGALPGIQVILCQWLIAGWFPVFPWLAVSLLGAQVGTFRWQGDTIHSFARPAPALLGAGLLLLGSVAWYFMPGPSLIRLGYAELFYPPGIAFLAIITGAIFCLFVIADLLPVAGWIFDPLRAMGECSLAIYILHSVVIAIIFVPLGRAIPLPGFLGIYLVFIAGMVLAAYLLRYVRQRSGPLAFPLRVLIGG